MSHQLTEDGLRSAVTSADADVHAQVPDEPAALTVDDLVPLWQREPGKRGALSKDEKTAKAENAERRAAVKELIDRALGAEQEVQTLKQEKGVLLDQLGANGGTISEMSTQVRTLQSQLRRIRDYLPYGIVTLARIASRTQRPVKDVTIGAEQYPVLSYDLGGIYVEHRPGDRLHELTIDPAGLDGAAYRFSDLPSDRQMDAIAAYLDENAESNTDTAETMVTIVTCADPTCRRCTQFKHDARSARTPGEYMAIVRQYANDSVHADAQQYLDEMFGSSDWHGILGNNWQNLPREPRDPWL